MVLPAIGTPESMQLFSTPNAGMAPMQSGPLPFGTGANPTTYDAVRGYFSGPSADAVYSPGTNRILDLLRSRGMETRNRGISEAQALAVRRGIQGSSTEQFGVQQAGAEADKATIDSETSVLLNNLKMAQERDMMAAKLASDELASIRNFMFGQQNLDLQRQLGQQGIDAANANADAARDAAEKQAQYGLIGTIGQTFLPRLFNMGGNGLPGTAGASGAPSLFARLFGNGGGGAAGGAELSSMIMNGGAPAPAGAASSLFPGGLGNSGTPGVAGAGTPFSGMAGLFGNVAGGLAGNYAGQKVFGPTKYGQIGGLAGGVLGSFFGPLGTAAGSFLGQGAAKLYESMNDDMKAVFLPFLNPKNTIKQIGGAVSKVGSSVSKAVKKVFPF